MRVHLVNTLVALAVTALITFGISSIDGNTLKGQIGIGSFIFIASTLVFAIGITFDNVRMGINVRLISWIFFVVGLLLNLLFALVAFSQTSYIITSGVVFLIYVLVANSIFSAKQ